MIIKHFITEITGFDCAGTMSAEDDSAGKNKSRLLELITAFIGNPRSDNPSLAFLGMNLEFLSLVDPFKRHEKEKLKTVLTRLFPNLSIGPHTTSNGIKINDRMSFSSSPQATASAAKHADVGSVPTHGGPKVRCGFGLFCNNHTCRYKHIDPETLPELIKVVAIAHPETSVSQLYNLPVYTRVVSKPTPE